MLLLVRKDRKIREPLSRDGVTMPRREDFVVAVCEYAQTRAAFNCDSDIRDV
jgi:hypothetical protein